MKDRLTETKFKSRLGLTSQWISSAVCLGAVLLICSSALAQSLFVSGSDTAGGKISKITWDGLQSTFASGLHQPQGLAFDGAGNLYVADYASGSIIEIKPNGTRATFALGLAGPIGLAFDSAGNLFVADYCGDSNGVTGSIIYKFKPSGARSAFISGLALNQCFSYLAFQPAQITPEATPTPQPTLPATRATENVLPTPTPWHTPLWSPSPAPSRTP